jgi:membrane protease YdiL (CAAX protease family)
MLIFLPIISFFNIPSTTQSEEVETLPENAKLMFEIFLLVTQFAIVIILMVIFPVLWYIIVNKCNTKEIISRLKLRLKGFNTAFLWAVLSVILMFAVTFIISILLTNMGVADDDQGNIQDIETNFSIASMLILLAIQPTFEEIFFRGFLLDKIKSYGGDYTSIVLTGVLFGLAHMSPGKISPALAIIPIGFILAFIVIKTKSLYSAILAHTAFNLISFALYLFAKSLS